MYYTKAQIDRINSGRLAEEGKKYYQDNGLVWIGLYSKKLKQHIDPIINATSTIYQINEHVVNTVTDELDSINNNIDIINGNKVFTYDVDKNLTQIKVYSDIALTDLLSTKNLTYDVDGNLTTLVEITPTNTTTSTFTYNIDGDLTNKTIT